MPKQGYHTPNEINLVALKPKKVVEMTAWRHRKLNVTGQDESKSMTWGESEYQWRQPELEEKLGLGAVIINIDVAVSWTGNRYYDKLPLGDSINTWFDGSTSLNFNYKVLQSIFSAVNGIRYCLAYLSTHFDNVHLNQWAPYDPITKLCAWRS